MDALRAAARVYPLSMAWQGCLRAGVGLRWFSSIADAKYPTLASATIRIRRLRRRADVASRREDRAGVDDRNLRSRAIREHDAVLRARCVVSCGMARRFGLGCSCRLERVK